MLSRTVSIALAVLGSVACFPTNRAAAQAVKPTIFVANNSALEGSVTTYRLDARGTPSFVSKFVIGERDPSDPPISTTNALAIDLSPNGRLLAVTHFTTIDGGRLTILRVAADGTLSVVASETGIASSFDCAWIGDEIVAITRGSGGNGGIATYAVDAPDGSIDEADFLRLSGTVSSFDRHPNGIWLLAGETDANQIYSVEIDPGSGAITLLQALATGFAPFDVTINNAGTRAYAAESSTGREEIVFAVDIDPSTGKLAPARVGPWPVFGDRPFNIAISPDDSVAYVTFKLFGNDDYIGSYDIASDGDLISTTNRDAIGGSFRFGDAQTLSLGSRDILLYTDFLEGLHSFGIDNDASFDQPNGPPVPTGGPSGWYFATWTGSGCPADLSSPTDPGVPDGVLTGADFFEFLARFQAGDLVVDYSRPTNPGVPDGVLTGADFFEFLNLFRAGC